MNKLILAASAGILTLTAAPANAGTVITGVDALREWNLVVLGNLSSSSEVEGRTFVGGNLTGNSSNYQIRTPNASTYGTAGLTVVGDVAGGTKNIQAGGVDVGGTVYSGFNLNGAPQTVQAGGLVYNTNVNSNTLVQNLNTTDPGFLAGLTAQRDALDSSLTSLSSTFAGMSATNTATFSGNRLTFDVVPDSAGLAVFSLTAADLNRIGEIQFNLNGADTVIVNVSGSAVTLNDNFLGNSSGLGEHVIWNFSEAATLTGSTAFKGSVLAPNAIVSTYNYIEGSVVVRDFYQNGEVHLGNYIGTFTEGAGAVPEPATWAMLVLGFGVIGAGLRSPRQRATRKLAAA